MKLTVISFKSCKHSQDRHVFAGEKYEAGQLKLVPYSPILFNAAVEGKEKTPINSRSFQIKIRLKETFTVTFKEPGERFYTDATFERHVFVPHWHVIATRYMDRANMQFATLKCTMSVATGNETADGGVSIPILQNFKALKKNEELLVFEDACAERILSIKKEWRQIHRRRPGYLDISKMSELVGGKGRSKNNKVYKGVYKRKY